MSIFQRNSRFLTICMIMPIVIGVFVAVTVGGKWPPNGLGVLLFLLGFWMFFAAKFSVILKGKFFTFGPAQGGMTSGMRGLYFAGYAGMVGGWVLAFWM